MRRVAWWTIKIVQAPFIFVCWLLEELAEKTGA
jgi:hypothetical protein